MKIKKCTSFTGGYALLLLLFISSISQAQSQRDTLRKIDLIFAEMNSESPGAAVRVSRGDQVLYSKGFGMSDLEHHVAVTDSTIFEAGSVSKQFTATSILLLALQGKLDLDDQVQKYVPELPRYEKPIIIRHLLNHTSGIRDWGSLAALGGWPRGTRTYTNGLALQYIVKQKGLNNVPGDEYLYSNSNYTLLTIIVERVSGKSLPEFTKQYIFEPLGMNKTQWRANFKSVVNDRALGYDRVEGEFYTNMPFENTYGHAALLTNVKELDIWNRSWKNSPLGAADLLKMRVEQGILNDGQKISYAAGVMIDSFNGHREVSHSGATAGYRCWLGYYPDDDLSIVYLSNATYFPTVASGRKISEIYLGTEPAKKKKAVSARAKNYWPETNELKSLTGNYYSPECGGNYEISVKNGQLWLNDHVNRHVVLKAVAKNMFEANGTRYIFTGKDFERQISVSASRARNVKFFKE